MPDQREALARRPAEDHIDLPLSNPRCGSNRIAGQISNICTDGGAVGEVVLVSRGMDGVVLHCRHDLKTCLLEAVG